MTQSELWAKLTEGRPITIVSYDSGAQGQVTSEWLSDKLRVLENHSVRAVLITSPKSTLISSSLLSVHKPRSLGWSDFNDEAVWSQSGKANTAFGLLAATLGRMFDFLFLKLAGSQSYGKWSWVFTAFPAALVQVIRSKSRTIFCTGGPSAAHLIGVLVKCVYPRVRLFVEFQDPLIGSEMGLNSRSQSVLMMIERLILRLSTKVVLVTEHAATDIRTRYKRKLNKIHMKVKCVYPGSWDFKIAKPVFKASVYSRIRMVHLGSLYTTRNLDLLFEAIETLKAQGVQGADQIEIVNQGGVYLGNGAVYLKRPDFSVREIVQREKGLVDSLESDFLLLIQHSDSRSEQTIPFKFYDYLMLGLPIIGLTNNSELENLILESGGFVGSSTDLKKTVLALKDALSSVEKGTLKESHGFALKVEKQFIKIFE